MTFRQLTSGCFFRALLLRIALVMLSAPLLAQLRPIADIQFQEQHTKKYIPQPAIYRAVLKMGYGKAAIENPQAWSAHAEGHRPVQVDLVFTNYPSDKARWIIPYDRLLQERIDSITALIPQLKSDTLVRWNLVLQTECHTAEQAQAMFHGAIVTYRPKITPSVRKNINQVRKIVLGKSAFEDSVVFRVFERNRWEKMLIVNDWTGSMYDYGAQAMLWYRLNMARTNVTRFVFFNDGNFTPDHQKEIGKTGGVYSADPKNAEEIIQTMLEVMANGNGGDAPENDVEALLFAERKFGEAGVPLVLIADNNNSIRDLALAKYLKTPVKVILCGMSPFSSVHPDYLELARITGGSVHTLQEDIERIGEQMANGKLTIRGKSYTIHQGRLELASAEF